MTQHSKTLRLSDYEGFQEQLKRMEELSKLLPAVVGSEHRGWEYAMAERWLRDVGAVSVLDVGGGGSLLAPFLTSLGYKVTTIDPAPTIYAVPIQASRLRRPIEWHRKRLEDLPVEGRYDAAVAISVADSLGPGFLRNLVDRSRFGAFVTTAQKAPTKQWRLDLAKILGMVDGIEREEHQGYEDPQESPLCSLALHKPIHLSIAVSFHQEEHHLDAFDERLVELLDSCEEKNLKTAVILLESDSTDWTRGRLLEIYEDVPGVRLELRDGLTEASKLGTLFAMLPRSDRCVILRPGYEWEVQDIFHLLERSAPGLVLTPDLREMHQDTAFNETDTVAVEAAPPFLVGTREDLRRLLLSETGLLLPQEAIRLEKDLSTVCRIAS